MARKKKVNIKSSNFNSYKETDDRALEIELMSMTYETLMSELSENEEQWYYDNLDEDDFF